MIDPEDRARASSALGGERPGVAVRARRVEGPPVVAVRVWLRGGARAERIPGEALVTGRLLAEGGTRRRDWRAVAEEAEARGMSLASFSGFEGIGVAADALAADWELALEWAAELALEPAFAAGRCAWIARQAAAELDSLADQADVVAGWKFLEHLYHPHPRSRPLHGSRESLARLTPEDCEAFHRHSLAWGLVVTLAGRIDPEAAARRAEEVFSAASGAAAPLPEPAPAAGLREPRTEVRTGADDQVHVYLGHLTVPRADPSFPALELLGVVLGSGSGLAGRIPERIREREGLAYLAYAETVAGAGRDPGRLVLYAAASPAAAERVRELAGEELARLVKEGVTPAEMEQARSYLLGREPFRRETARQWADLLAEAEFSGLPVDRPEWVTGAIEALTLDEVNEVARLHLHPDRLKVTIGWPGEVAQYSQ